MPSKITREGSGGLTGTAALLAPGAIAAHAGHSRDKPTLLRCLSAKGRHDHIPPGRRPAGDHFVRAAWHPHDGGEGTAASTPASAASLVWSREVFRIWRFECRTN